MKFMMFLLAVIGFNCHAGLTDLIKCDQDIREKIEKSYHDGYLAGLQAQNTKNAKTEINVNVASNGSTSGAKRVYCELKPFTKTYSAWGESELEAKINVGEKCKKEYNEMHCTDFDCKKAE